jgi:hypothetical protein
MKPIRNKARFWAAVLCLGHASCIDPDRLSITREGSETRLIDGSPEVDRLLSIQKARDTVADLMWKKQVNKEEAMKRFLDSLVNPERYAPGRKKFLLAMSQQPGILVPEKTYVRVLAGSGAECGPIPGHSFTFVRVRVTSGPLRGREGWVCQGDVGGTFAMP